MAPVTPNVPPTVSLPVIVALAKVVAPAANVDENVPAPVTFKAPPKVVVPVPTMNVLAPLMEVFPLNIFEPAIVCAVVKSTKF